MVKQVELSIDVTDAAGLDQPAHVAATVVLPEPAMLGSPAIICFARPSSSYSRGYYTYELPGPAKGAQATFHADRGWIFAALDMLGCGGSSQHDLDRLDYATLAAAAHAAEQEILLRLANGVLLEDYPPVHQPVAIGIGHALGAGLTIYQQARHRSYAGIATLGFSAVHSHPSTPPGAQPIVAAWFPRDAAPEDCAEPLNARALARATEGGPQDSAWTSLAWGFHYDDVPQEVVEQDLRHYAAVAEEHSQAGEHEIMPWNSTVTPRCAARSTLTPGVVATEAAVLTVPVLCAMGVRDLVPDPLGEPRAFRSARSIDLFVCPRMGHVHNFAGTRALMWERIHMFGQWCAAVNAAG
ncbi:MAG: hypothetical protein R3E09_10455 [Novosphingobium sp.]|nr:hypothetical protein [Novosphingobium sp.]MCB2080812.1 hypothetical protein [Novosphingobium sp.]